MPAVTDEPRPNGLPMAITQSPMRALSESPKCADGRGFLEETLSSARSVFSSRPISLADSEVPSFRVTVICSAFSITWLLVTISPLGSMTKPEPSEVT